MTQAQQATHREASMEKSALMAVAEQTARQMPHPEHLSLSSSGRKARGAADCCSLNSRTKAMKRFTEASGDGSSCKSAALTGLRLPARIFSPANFPNSSAAFKSSASGRPAATGVSEVLYECSQTKAPAATGLKPRSETNAASSARAPSKARFP